MLERFNVSCDVFLTNCLALKVGGSYSLKARDFSVPLVRDALGATRVMKSEPTRGHRVDIPLNNDKVERGQNFLLQMKREITKA